MSKQKTANQELEEEEESEGTFSRIKDSISRSAIRSRLHAARVRVGETDRPTILHYTILISILIVAAIIRLLPIRWGGYISEFDPYSHYNNAREIVNNGWQSWFTFTDTNAWYPFGRNSLTTTYPGNAFIGAAIYLFLQSIGVQASLQDVFLYTPVILGAIAALVVYYFTRETWGRSAGLAAALLMAFNSSLISRSSLGFFDNESIGIPAMILVFLFYLRAIDPLRSLKATIIYSFLASLSLITMAFSWGSFRYVAEVIAIFTLALVILKRYTPRLPLAYGITTGFFLYTGTQIPQLGRLYLTEGTTFAIIGVMVILLFIEASSQLRTGRARWSFLGIAGASVVLVIAALFILGVFSEPLLRGKFATVLNPFIRNNVPLIASVAENRPATWASFFLELGGLPLLGVFGFVFAFQRLRSPDILLIVYGATAFYFAASLVRLSLLLAPAISVLAAITVVELGKPAVDIMRQAVIFPRRKIRYSSYMNRESALVILFIVFLIILPVFFNAVQSAYTPVTIASASLPTRSYVPDWLETLSWMQTNLPSTGVVFAWWDYGYWISVTTQRHTLADNGTGNQTQIKLIATGFMLNESMAIHLMKQYGVTHVAVFVSYNRGPAACGSSGNFCGFGEDSKWYWMLRIGNDTNINTPLGLANVKFKAITNTQGQITEYQRIVTINGQGGQPERITTQGTGSIQLPTSNTVLGHLMRDGSPTAISDSSDIDTHSSDPAQPGTFDSYFTREFASSNHYVLVYSVKYPQPARLNLAVNTSQMPRTGGNVTLSGSLTTSTGQPTTPTDASKWVILQYSTDTIEPRTWHPIANVTLTSGQYSYTWITSPFTNGINKAQVRAVWPGDRKQMLDFAVSDVRILDITG